MLILSDGEEDRKKGGGCDGKWYIEDWVKGGTEDRV